MTNQRRPSYAVVSDPVLAIVSYQYIALAADLAKQRSRKKALAQPVERRIPFAKPIELASAMANGSIDVL